MTSHGSTLADRPLVLLESEDGSIQYAVTNVLENEGYDVVSCDGPNRMGRRGCPLVTGGECALADAADVIVHALNDSRPEHATVLGALRERYPDTPIVVEVPGQARARRADLLAGCTRLPMPMTSASLRRAVSDARRGAGRPASPAASGRGHVDDAGAAGSGDHNG